MFRAGWSGGFALAALLAGCGPAAAPPVDPPRRPPATPAADAPTPRPVPAAAPAPDLAAAYTADMARAVAGAKKTPFAATGGFGGMACEPGRLANTDAASRALTLTLPADPAARRRVLAVVTPERGLLEVYSPYDDGTEAGDLTIPSTVISWAEARTRDRFAANTDLLTGLRPGRTEPEVLFLEAGRYRFALLDGIDADLLRTNRRAVTATAGCSFDWTP